MPTKAQVLEAPVIGNEATLSVAHPRVHHGSSVAFVRQTTPHRRIVGDGPCPRRNRLCLDLAIVDLAGWQASGLELRGDLLSSRGQYRDGCNTSSSCKNAVSPFKGHKALSWPPPHPWGFGTATGTSRTATVPDQHLTLMARHLRQSHPGQYGTAQQNLLLRQHTRQDRDGQPRPVRADDGAARDGLGQPGGQLRRRDGPGRGRGAGARGPASTVPGA